MSDTFLTPEQLAMTEDQLRDLLNERALIDWTGKVKEATIAYIDLVNKRQGAINLEVKQETDRITKEQDTIWNEDIKAAKEDVAQVKKNAHDAGVELDLVDHKGMEGQSDNPKHHLMWTGTKYALWLLQYRKDHETYTVDDMISEYNEYKTGGPLKNPHLKNNIQVNTWSTEELEHQLALTYSCSCCADKGNGWTRPVKKKS